MWRLSFNQISPLNFNTEITLTILKKMVNVSSVDQTIFYIEYQTRCKLEKNDNFGRYKAD